MTTRDAAMSVGSVDDGVIQSFQESLRGELLRPGDSGYDAARTIWNAMIDRRPVLIARCAGAADVIAAVKFATEHELLVSVKGGGHGVAGTAVADGGLMIDLSPMNGIEVDAARRTARAGGGATWGEFDRETQAHGRAATGGAGPTSGIASLTRGGGLGDLSRRLGRARDHPLAAGARPADAGLQR